MFMSDHSWSSCRTLSDGKRNTVIIRKPFVLPIDIQHTQYTCWFFTLEKRDTSSAVKNYETETLHLHRKFRRLANALPNVLDAKSCGRGATNSEVELTLWHPMQWCMSWTTEKKMFYIPHSFPITPALRSTVNNTPIVCWFLCIRIVCCTSAIYLLLPAAMLCFLPPNQLLELPSFRFLSNTHVRATSLHMLYQYLHQ